MTARPCPQAGLVEALHDGRLGAPERQSIERHLRVCSDCAALKRELGEVGDALRTQADPLTPLVHQRARLALLRAAVVAPPPPVSRPPWVAAAAVLVLAGTTWAAVSAWRPSPRHEVELAASAAPSVSSDAPAGAHTHVDAPAAARPSVDLPAPPDPGIHAAHAARSGAPARTSTAASAAASAPRATIDAPAPVAPLPVEAPPIASTPAAVTSAAAEPPLPIVSAASRDFAAAMEALGSGDFGRAAARFVAFTAAHPFDPRSDEAAYLVAIALERAGRSGEARAAAQRYLDTHPRGAHRAQAAKLVR